MSLPNSSSALVWCVLGSIVCCGVYCDSSGNLRLTGGAALLAQLGGGGVWNVGKERPGQSSVGLVLLGSGLQRGRLESTCRQTSGAWGLLLSLVSGVALEQIS